MFYKLSKNYPSKRAFITGAASGLGKELCLELAKDGWTIGIGDINLEGLEATAQEIEKLGGKVISHKLDVSEKAHYKVVVEDFLRKTGGVDLLINNAGVGDGGLFEEYSLDNWKWIVGINLLGVIHGCHFIIPVMKKQRSGLIINVSSIASISNSPHMAGYNVTKAGVKALSETLYGELKEFNVKVSVMMPFFFRTNIMQFARGDHEARELGKIMVGGSKVSANEIAKRALKQAGKGKFYILEPFQAKVLFNVQRLFPRWFLDMSTKMMIDNRDKVLAKVRKQFNKHVEEGKITEHGRTREPQVLH